MIDSSGQQVVKQGVHGNEPTVLLAQSLHKESESGLNPVPLLETHTKMSVHDAGSPIFFEAVLISFAYALVETLDVGAF